LNVEAITQHPGGDKEFIFRTLLHNYYYYEKKRKNIINILKLLLDNGMKLDNIFFLELTDNLRDKEDIFLFIESIKEYIDTDTLTTLFDILYRNFSPFAVETAKKLIRMFESPTLYLHLKNIFSNFEEKFADIIAEYPWFEATNKYNL
jgi:hypothetical protein